MVEEEAWNSLELFQLKECYELAVLHVNDEMAKNVLREKAKSIEIPKDYIPVQEEVSYQETEMQILSDALYELTLEGNASSTNSVFKYRSKIESLPDSGEKEYILALLCLRNGTGETNRIKALDHLMTALTFAPNDPRFVALARILEEAG